LPALAAAVVTNKGLVAVGAVGVRKRGSNVPVTINDQFHLGSNTKALTATLVALLVEQGLLRYSDTLGKVFPGLARQMSPELRRVTLAQLLTHRAGLPHDLEGGYAHIAAKHRLGRRAKRHQVLLQLLDTQLESRPGTRFRYSNLGYLLAGHMAEKAADRPWEELMERHLFGPLGMQSAGYGVMGTPNRIDQPWQHNAQGRPLPPIPANDAPLFKGPPGRVHVSLPDWAKFIADLLRGWRGQKGLLRPATYRKLERSPFAGHFYTLGGWTGTPGGVAGNGLLLVHNGSNMRSFALAWLNPATDLAILVATNQGGQKAAQACREVKDLLIRKYLKKQ
jgi:CubicO group peptidase (beta-lactamase class C family)